MQRTLNKPIMNLDTLERSVFYSFGDFTPDGWTFTVQSEFDIYANEPLMYIMLEDHNNLKLEVKLIIHNEEFLREVIAAAKELIVKMMGVGICENP